MPEKGADETEAGKFKLGYQPSLDGLRGIAILAVMAFNGHLLFMEGGFLGVDVFFVLSGFLITSILLQGYSETSRFDFKNFYVRRALRLLPALLALIVFVVAFALVFESGDRLSNTVTGVIYTLFYVANWAQVPPFPPGIGPLSHAWSLSVEEQFYIVWPLLLFLLLRLRSRVVLIAAVVAMILASSIASVLMWNAGVPYLRMYFGSDVRAHELLIGCLAALMLYWGVFSDKEKLKTAFQILAPLSLAGILFSFFAVSHQTGFVYNGGFALVSLATAVLILGLVLYPSKLSRVFEFGPLVWIGQISYGLYLWHFPVIEGTRKFFEGSMPPVLLSTAGVLMSVGVAAVSYYLLELRFLRLKRRFRKETRSKPIVVPKPTTAESV
ncbi:MAG: acyltransferase [Acidobacteriota bacterium]|nr:MAG: acyltransferase [Acidobacteriota bacterium]